MPLRILKNPLYQVLSVMLLIAVAAIWTFDLFSLKTVISGIFGVGVAGFAMAMPVAIAPFPQDPELTSAVVAYKNGKLIQDEAFPIVPVGLQTFKYRKFGLADGFTIPDTRVGRTSSPNKVEFGFTEESDVCVAHGLFSPVPDDDVKNAPPGFDPLTHAAVSTMDLVLIDREKRCADLMFNPDSYAASNKEALSSTGMFSDYTNSDPLSKLLDVLDGMLMRANKIFMGQSVWTKMRKHPKLVSAALGNSGSAGVVKREQLAELLEVDSVIVGQGWVNTAKKGQNPSMVRLWGNYISMVYSDAMVASTTEDRVTFGITAQWGSRTARTDRDSTIGLNGGTKVTAGMYTKELVTANDLAFLLSNVI